MTTQIHATTAPVVLNVRNVSHSYGQTTVLDHVSFQVQAGEVVSIMGPSGSGKSTLLHIAGGLLTPDRGSVEIEGVRIENMAERKRSRMRLEKIGFVFQFGDLVPELTIIENVELPLRLTGIKAGAAKKRALDLLEILGIADQANKQLNQVSGGQAQRTAVARALSLRPSIILADEPTGALDTIAGELVLESLIGAARDRGSAVVIVTHELRVASWTERDIYLRDGKTQDDPDFIIAGTESGAKR